MIHPSACAEPWILYCVQDDGLVVTVNSNPAAVGVRQDGGEGQVSDQVRDRAMARIGIKLGADGQRAEGARNEVTPSRDLQRAKDPIFRTS